MDRGVFWRSNVKFVKNSYKWILNKTQNLKVRSWKNAKMQITKYFVRRVCMLNLMISWIIVILRADVCFCILEKRHIEVGEFDLIIFRTKFNCFHFGLDKVMLFFFFAFLFLTFINIIFFSLSLIYRIERHENAA